MGTAGGLTAGSGSPPLALGCAVALGTAPALEFGLPEGAMLAALELGFGLMLPIPPFEARGRLRPTITASATTTAAIEIRTVGERQAARLPDPLVERDPACSARSAARR